jgi:hypothetical protein
MPSTMSLKSDVDALVASLPTVKEAILARQGLKSMRDALLYKHDGGALVLSDSDTLHRLGATELLMAWLSSKDGAEILADLTVAGGETFLKAFDAALKKVDLIQLTLAYSPTTDDLTRYHAWFTHELKRPILLDVKTDPRLIAGFTAMYNDRLLDYSAHALVPQMQARLQELYAQKPAKAKTSAASVAAVATA